MSYFLYSADRAKTSSARKRELVEKKKEARETSSELRVIGINVTRFTISINHKTRINRKTVGVLARSLAHCLNQCTTARARYLIASPAALTRRVSASRPNIERPMFRSSPITDISLRDEKSKIARRRRAACVPMADGRRKGPRRSRLVKRTLSARNRAPDLLFKPREYRYRFH